MERTNVRTLAALPEKAQLGVVDVSFISLKLALPLATTNTTASASPLTGPESGSLSGGPSSKIKS